MEYFDLKKQYYSIKKEIDRAISKTLSEGIFVMGKPVEEFENNIAKYCGIKYGVGLNSGTDALWLSLVALGIKAGDEVITTPFTMMATADAIIKCGAKPVFVDIDPKTFNIDPGLIEDKITEKTKCIIPVHMFGLPADMVKIKRIAKKHGLFLVEDVAQGIGGSIKNKKVGSFGDIGCLSFFPSKNLGGYGDGGMLITSQKDIAQKVRILRAHGAEKKYYHIYSGLNSRLDTLQAAVLNVKLKHLNEWTKARRLHAKKYNLAFASIQEIATPFVPGDFCHVYHQYTIRIKERDKLRKYLSDQGIPTMLYYPLCLHLQPVFKHLGYKEGDMPEAERTTREVLSLPIYPELSVSDQSHLIKVISKYFK